MISHFSCTFNVIDYVGHDWAARDRVSSFVTRLNCTITSVSQVGHQYWEVEPMLQCSASAGFAQQSYLELRLRS